MTHVVTQDGRRTAGAPSPLKPPSPTRGATFTDVRRQLAARFESGAPVTSAIPLELLSRGVQDAPSLREVDVLESGTMRAHLVECSAAALPRFAAFLDGAQWSLVIWADGVPIVHGTVAAVVRQRENRRMSTWRSAMVQRALYAPLALLPSSWTDALAALDLEIVDTLEKRTPESGHPFELQEIAYQAVLSAREAIEKELAEAWCESTTQDLFVDGGIAGSKRVARAANVVGVVKSHQRLYANAGDLPVLMRLEAGERSSVIRVADAKRAPVASWYLRLRDVSGHDPFWGLVRVEVALNAKSDSRSLSDRADEVSRWILAEALPLSVPDARWDKMVYGIRDCEEYLRAIQ